MSDVLTIIAAYLLGAIPFGLLIPRIFGISDIRKIGSGNVGATNAWRSAGPPAGILVMIFDIGKGAGAVLLVGLFTEPALNAEYLKMIAGFAAIMGHIFPVYMKFKGGKGVNTALGVMLTLLPIEALIGLVVFIVTVSLSRYISLGSILAVTAFFVSVLIRWLFVFADINPVYVLTALILNVLIIAAHHSNIKRLINGNENRFHFKSKSTGNTKVRENV